MKDELVLTVGDVKQYFYCPRIVYYNYLMPGFRPVTYKMEEGKIRQKEEERLEKRRSLSRFRIPAYSPDRRNIFRFPLAPIGSAAHQRKRCPVPRRQGSKTLPIEAGHNDVDNQNPSKLFNVRLLSSSLGLSGMLDMVILTEDEAIPVDFKDGAFSKGNAVALHHKYQLMAYGLLLEDSYSGKESKIGFIRSLEDGGIRSVVFSEGAKMFLRGKIRKMRRMILEEIFPEETPYKGRCWECEFRPVCKG